MIDQREADPANPVPAPEREEAALCQWCGADVAAGDTLTCAACAARMTWDYENL